MDKAVIDLANYRLEQSWQCIKSAEVLTDADDCKGAANRSYYAIFHAMRAVLALDGVDFSKHSGVSSYFRREYIKTGIFEAELSDIIKLSFDTRSDCDYDDFYMISKQDVLDQIENAKFFCKNVQEYIHSRTKG